MRFFLRRERALVCVFLAGWLLAGCATLTGGPRQVEVPLARIQERLDQRFPLDKRALEIFQIRLAQPRLTTVPEQERLLITLATAISTPLTPVPWKGRLALSSRLAIDSARNAIVMQEVRVEQLSADGMDESRQRSLAKIMDFVADHILQDSVLYSFKADELRHFGTLYVPIAIRPTADALRLTFEPASAAPGATVQLR
jgi:hypothetical protein